ncbi:MAG: ABC transporter permease [Coriobacteriales bacterium]|jgi:sodium transport system permease protein|nr:ABC transporter permease [Coriobacteriales bacterium]
MRSGFSTILRKELNRFFTDKRMLFTSILLPGLMIFLLYSTMGTAIQNMRNVEDDYKPVAYAVNIPDSIRQMSEAAGITFTDIKSSEVADIKAKIENKEADLLVVFSPDFSEKSKAIAANETPVTNASDVPSAEVFHNSLRTESLQTSVKVTGVLEAHKSMLMPLFTINGNSDTHYDLATAKDAAGFSFGSMLPMLILIFLFSGAMGVAAESIAGEKERGTIATMLITPLKRWELAAGKIISISCIALLGGLSSFIGTMAAIPTMLGDVTNDVAELSASIYGIGDFLAILAITLVTVLIFVGAISIISAFAKSVKEAGTLVMPLMILVMLVGVMGMFSKGAQTEILYYLIPVYNSAQALTGIFTFTAQPLFIAITVVENIIITGICVFALTKMFGSEKILFKK